MSLVLSVNIFLSAASAEYTETSSLTFLTAKKMISVYNKEELRKALENRESAITVKGKLAEELYHMNKKKKRIGILGGLIIAASIVAIPFTGGASAIGGATIFGATAALTIGTITISTLELAILCGTVVVVINTIVSRAKVTFRRKADGTIEADIEPKYKTPQNEEYYKAN